MNDTLKAEFLEACGGTDSLRLIVEHPDGVSEHVFQQPYALIGRSPLADIRFDIDRLAQRHAYLQMIAGRVLFVNFMYHVENRQTGWLDPGDAIEIGPLRVRLHEGTALPDWCQAGYAQPVPPHAARAIHFDVHARGIRSSWRMRQPIALIGNSSACKVRLHDREVSRFHCSLVNTSTGLWVLDLLSTRGVKVDSERVELARLEEGTRLAVGGFAMTVRRDESRWDVAPSDVIQLPDRTRAMLETASAVPATAADSAAPLANTGEVLEKVDSPLVVQLAQMQQNLMVQMQQQMADQFQQAMSYFVEAFWSMHREQARAVKRELRRIRALTQELNTLQERLAKTSAETKAPEAAHFTLNIANAVTAAAPPAMTPPAVEPVSTPALVAAAPTIRPDPPKKQPSRPIVAASAPPSPKQPDPAVIKPTTPPTPPSPPAATPSPPAANQPSPANMHAWLNQRVGEIQRQRQSSWQRLLSVLQGKSGASSAGPAP